MHTAYKKLLLALVLMIFFYLSWTELPYLCPTPGQALPIERKLSCPSVVWAEPEHPSAPDKEQEPPPPQPPPDNGGEGEGEGESGGGNPIQRIFQTILHIINFPTDALADTLDELIGGYINGFLQGFQDEVGKLFAHTILSSPDLEAEPFASAWGSMRTVAMVLWPMTLALIAVLASHGTVTSAAWSLANVKEELADWFLSVLFSFFSLYLCSLFNRLTLGMTEMIMSAGFGADLTVGGLAGLLISGWNFMEIVPEEGGIILALFLLAMAVAVILALAFQYIARYTVLFVLVALAPVAITLGVLSPLKWLKWMWMKGFILVALLGPINALILKLIAAMGLATGGSGFLGTLAGLLITIGLASILITLDGTIIKMVFAGAIAVAEQLRRSIAPLVAMVTAAASIAAGFLPGAGMAAAGAGGSSGGSSQLMGGGGAMALSGGGVSGGGGTAVPGGTPSAEGGGSGASAAPQAPGAGRAGFEETTTGPGAGGMRMRQALREDAATQAQQQHREQRGGAFSPAGAGVLSQAGRILRAGFRPGSVGAVVGEGLIQAGASLEPQRPSEVTRPSRMSELQGMTAQLGLSPLSPQGRQVTGALALLEGHYRPEAVRRAAGRALAPIAAARRSYLPMEDMARAEGFGDAGSFVGGWIEDQIEAQGEDDGKTRLFHRDAGQHEGVNPRHDAAPGWYDYKSGALLAQTLEGTSDHSRIQMYAGLHHAFRDPQYRGMTGGNELVQAARDARRRGEQGGVSPLPYQQMQGEFTQWVDEKQNEWGIPDSHLPQRWIETRGVG